MIETVALFLVTNILAQGLKIIVYPRFGVLGVQASVFIIAVAGAVIWYAALANEGVMSALMQGVEVFTYAIAFYEVVLKNIRIKGWEVITTKDL